MRPLWSSSDPYRNNPVVRHIWNTTGAIPVLPPQLDRGVFAVLMRSPSDGRYQVVGDLGSLCAPGDNKLFLQRELAAVAAASGGTLNDDNGGRDSSSSPYMTREALGTTTAGSAEDHTWSVKLLTMVVAGYERGAAWETTVREQEVEAAGAAGFWDLLGRFSPDPRHPLLLMVTGGGQGGTRTRRGHRAVVVELFVVRKVVRAREIEIVETRRGGTHAGAGVPDALGPLLDLAVPGASALQVEARVAGAGSVHYRVTAAGSSKEGGAGGGSKDGGGRPRLLPIAFSGVRVRYVNGVLQSANLTSVSTDGPGEMRMAWLQEVAAADDEGDGPGPLQDENLREFVDESNWFATVDGIL